MLIVLTALLACTGKPEPEATSPADPLDRGWIPEIVADPQSFGRLLEGSGREGWIAFHKGDYDTAARSLSGLAAWRARQEQGALAQDLARTASVAWPRTFMLWEKKSGLPEGSAIPVVAALAALDAGDAGQAQLWLSKGVSYADPHVAEVASQLTGGLSQVTGDGPLADCIQYHHQHRNPAAATGSSKRCPEGPLITEQGEGHTRTLFDPMLFKTMSAQRTPTGTAPEGSTLERLAFSSHWSDDDTALLASLGVDQPAAGDDPDAARDRIRTLDKALDAWSEKTAASASPEGVELLENLQLVEVFRSRLLLAWARQALEAGEPHAALAYAQMGLDVEHAREIGPLNPPGIFAALTEANLRTGHTREALDALQVLGDAHPEVKGLDETISDLAILEGLDRQGDSKEN